MNEYIYSDQITEQHICVAIISGTPCILGKGYHEPNHRLSWLILGVTDYNHTAIITKGNGYDVSYSHDTIQKMVDWAIDNKYTVKVYKKSDWKQALQWLIDNA
jgi:hypothetical protein